jgi:Mrp family chromosome partitioning ATPase
MRQLLEEARGAFDWVIVDTPPVALLPDANLLSAMVDGAVLVVRAETTPWDLAQRAVAAIGRERLLGVVLNGATAEAASDYYGYDYYSAPQTTTTGT